MKLMKDRFRLLEADDAEIEYSVEDDGDAKGELVSTKSNPVAKYKRNDIQQYVEKYYNEIEQKVPKIREVINKDELEDDDFEWILKNIEIVFAIYHSIANTFNSKEPSEEELVDCMNGFRDSFKKFNDVLEDLYSKKMPKTSYSSKNVMMGLIKDLINELIGKNSDIGKNFNTFSQALDDLRKYAASAVEKEETAARGKVRGVNTDTLSKSSEADKNDVARNKQKAFEYFIKFTNSLVNLDTNIFKEYEVKVGQHITSSRTIRAEDSGYRALFKNFKSKNKKVSAQAAVNAINMVVSGNINPTLDDVQNVLNSMNESLLLEDGTVGDTIKDVLGNSFTKFISTFGFPQIFNTSNNFTQLVLLNPGLWAKGWPHGNKNLFILCYNTITFAYKAENTEDFKKFLVDSKVFNGEVNELNKGVNVFEKLAPGELYGYSKEMFATILDTEYNTYWKKQNEENFNSKVIKDLVRQKDSRTAKDRQIKAKLTKEDTIKTFFKVLKDEKEFDKFCDEHGLDREQRQVLKDIINKEGNK